MEEWRLWRDGIYAVSNCGNVRRVRGGKGARAGKLVRRFIASHGYPVVNLCINGQPRVEYVHAMVAEAFIGPRPSGLQIDHRDGDKANCAPSNLEYVSRSENGRRASALGLLPSGSRHWNWRSA